MRRQSVSILVLSAIFLVTTSRAEAQSAERPLPRIGLAAGEPLTKSAPPATPFGRPPSESKDSVLDFHGYVLLPMRLAVLKREDPAAGQASTTVHSPPLLPQDETRFEYTGVVPNPWIQLNFSYGNSRVAATAVISAKSATDAAGFFDATKQLGVNNAFVSLNLSDVIHTPFEVKVGAFTGRYGAMGAYDAGRYGTPLIARTNTIGVTTSAAVDLGREFGLALEHGIGGSLKTANRDQIPAGWNDFGETGAAGSGSADAPNGVGTTLVNHLHAVLGYRELAQLGLHYLSAWTQDEQATPGAIGDGTVGVLGADLRLTLGRGGHFYAGFARTNLQNAATVSGVLEVLNARGGPELIREYLGPASGGDGGLSTFGAQYDLSVARMLYGDYFHGKSPDVILSVFGMSVAVDSDDPAYDGISKLKVGGEATYNLLSWFGVSTRFDHVTADTSDNDKAFNIFSPRALFHTDWMSRDEFALQYSYFDYGDEVIVRTGFPPSDDPGATPDEHVLSLTGTFWW